MDNITICDMFNFCNECAYAPAFCGREPEICAKEYIRYRQRKGGEADE